MPHGATLSALVLPDRHPPAQFVDDVRAAESEGIGTVWTYDHLTWPALADRPWHAMVPLLAAAAVATSTVRLGPQVATPNYRHPVPFAKEIATLDALSGGRLDLGLGAGTEGPDAAVLGDPPRSRRERTERYLEWVALLDRLLTDDEVTVAGERFSARAAHLRPACAQQPRVPFVLAGAGPRALRVAAELGQGWVTYGPYTTADTDAEEWFTAVEQQSGALTAAMTATGRDPGSIRRTVQFGLDTRWPFSSAQRYAEVRDRLQQIGIDDISVHWPRPDGRGLTRSQLELVLAAHR